MKKFLLIAMAVFTVAAASANVRAEKMQPMQVSNLNMKALKPFAGLQKKHVTNNVDLRTVQGTRLNKIYTGVQQNVPFKAPALNDIFGTYVEDFTQEGDGTTKYTTSYGVELSKFVYDGLELVELYDLCEGFADVLGEYDSEEGKLYIPAGTVCGFLNESTQTFDYDGEGYGEKDSPLAACVLIAFDQDEKGTDLVLNLMEDANGKYFVMDESLIGWMVVIAEGTYQNSYIQRGDDMLLNAANYGLTYSSLNLTDKTKEPEWEDNVQPMFLDFIGDGEVLKKIVCHNFIWGLNPTLNVEDGTVTMRSGQDLYFHEDYGEWMGFYTFKEDGSFDGSKERKMPVTYLNDGRFIFGTLVPDEQDPSQNVAEWDYLCYGISDQGWTGVEFAAAMIWPFEAWKEETGVHTVLAPVATDGAAFNLAGQRVATRQNGVVVRNGQKYIVK